MRDLNSNVVTPESGSEPGLLQYPSLSAGQAVTRVIHRCEDAEEDHQLDLSECQLMQMPDAVYHLMRNTVLMVINLSSNVLRRIPPKFALKFSHVTVLDLSHNHLSNLPDEMRDLRELRRLDISRNHFLSLPLAVFHMPALTQLGANKNYISDVDVNRLRGTSSLNELSLEDNPLTGVCRRHLSELSMKVHVSEPDEDMDDDMDVDDLIE